MHEQHRKRMRERYYIGGFDPFSDHEILEMLLYHSIPRGDTNELAHMLIERFGGFNGVVEASADELMTVKGIGENSAMLLKLIEASVRTYAKNTVNDRERYDTVVKLGRFAAARLVGLDHERLLLITLDNNMSLIDSSVIADGTVNVANVHLRRIVERAVSKKAASVVLVHNHPHGVAEPSASDIALTENLMYLLGLLDIPLLEHLIVSDGRCLSIMKKESLVSRLDCDLRLGRNGFDPDAFYGMEGDEFSIDPFEQRVATPHPKRRAAKTKPTDAKNESDG